MGAKNMSDGPHEYQFFGGSLDGFTQQIGGSLYPGMTWPGQSLPGRKREIYRLKDDGAFHFERYGLEPNPRIMMPDVLEELKPIAEELGAIFARLEAVYEKYGGPDGGGMTVGNWTV